MKLALFSIKYFHSASSDCREHTWNYYNSNNSMRVLNYQNNHTEKNAKGIYFHTANVRYQIENITLSAFRNLVQFHFRQTYVRRIHKWQVPQSSSYGVYISQLIRFARVSNHVVDFNASNKSLTVKLLQQGYRYHKLRKTFSKFYRRHYELVSKFNVGLKTLLHQGLSEPEFYADLVYKFQKIVGRADFSDQKNYRSIQTYWI